MSTSATCATRKTLSLQPVAAGISVPRIIHQVMMQGWDALPPELVDSIAALRGRNPGWEYRFYDAAAAEAFISRVYGRDMLAVYDSINPVYYAARSDLLRYLICYAEGGVYLDIKSTALRPLDEVIRPDDVYLLSQWAELRGRSREDVGRHAAAHPELSHVQGSEYVVFFIVAAPGHPFLKTVIDAVLQALDQYNVWTDGVGRKGVLRLTGPIAYTLAIEPMRPLTPHRYVEFEKELDFVASIYGDHKSHRTKLGVHYSQQTRPVVLQDPVTTALSQAWFGTVQPRLHGLRRRLRLSKR